MKQQQPPKPRGGANYVKPEGTRRVYVSVMLAPETVRLLDPYTQQRLRGQVIDIAVQAVLETGNLEDAQQRIVRLLGGNQ